MKYIPKFQQGEQIPTKKKVVVFAEAPNEKKRKYDDLYSLIDDKTPPAEFTNIQKNAKNVIIAGEKFYTDETFEKVNSLRKRRDEFPLPDKTNLSQIEIARLNPIDRKNYILFKALDNETKKEEQKLSRISLALMDRRLGLNDELRSFAGNFEAEAQNPTFIKEAENVKQFYRKNPNVEVDIVPFYGDTKLFNDKIKNLSKQDDILIFGHSGSKMGGISNDTLAKYINNSQAENCYLGSCNFQEFMGQFATAKGKKFHYRPNTNWLGFNPNAKTFEEGMWSRNNVPVYNKEGFYDETARIESLKLKENYNILTFQNGGEVKTLTGPTIRGKKYPEGTIITNNPNDPRLKSYQDSLSLYNISKEAAIDFMQSRNSSGISKTSWNRISKNYSRTDDIINRLMKQNDGELAILKRTPYEKVWENGNPGINVAINTYHKPVQPILYKPIENITRLQPKGLPTIPQLIPNPRIMPDVIYKDNNIPNAAYTGFDISHFTDSLGRWAAKFDASTTPGIRGKISTPNPNGNFIIK